MDNNEKFTRRDSKANTDDLPDISDSVQLEEDRRRRAMSYRERQRLENERLAAQAEARGEEVYRNPYINNRAQLEKTESGYEEFADMREAYAKRNAASASAEKQTDKSAKKKATNKKTVAKKKKRSVAYRVICGILGTMIALMLVFVGFVIYYIYNIDINNVAIDKQHGVQAADSYTERVEGDDGEEIRVVDTIHEGTETESFKSAIKEWKNAGSAYLKSNKVINVLLVGIDRNDDGSDGRSDTMILASLNMVTKEITLSSFYRDSWMYETFDNDERSAWAKLNASFVYGGPNGLIENLEDYYKIDIDHYVGVDFQSFLDIIDGLGGITVPVQEHEAAYINEQLCRETVTSGDAVHLQGDEALWFVRMRHSDADEEVSRTRRQRIFISALIDEFKNISLSEINNLVTTMFQYVQTDLTKTEIIQYGLRAMRNQWYNYEIKQQQVPDEAYRMEYLGSTWVWLVDYPGAAYAMQNGIYGYSNIVLDENRYTMLDIARRLINAGYEIV